jgi:hypothetical protein
VQRSSWIGPIRDDRVYPRDSVYFARRFLVLRMLTAMTVMTSRTGAHQ